MGNSGVAADDTAVADSNARQNSAKLTNPNVVLDDDGLSLRQRTHSWWDVRTVRVGTTVNAVVVVSNINLTSHENVVTNLDMIDAANMDILAEAHIVANYEARREMLRLPRLAV